MPLDEGDYLGWFNQEITRYRDYEWRVCSLVAAIGLGIVVWAFDSSRSELILRYRDAAEVLVLLTMLIFLLIEWHVHKSLNDYRERRDALVKAGLNPLVALEKKGKLIASAVDGIYLLLFSAFILAVGLFSCYALASAQGPCIK
jgi:cytochrome bd-type quinol oxidase subunit 2